MYPVGCVGAVIVLVIAGCSPADNGADADAASAAGGAFDMASTSGTGGAGTGAQPGSIVGTGGAQGTAGVQDTGAGGVVGTGGAVGTGGIAGTGGTPSAGSPDDKCTDLVLAPRAGFTIGALAPKYPTAKYLHIGQYGVHVAATAHVTDWMVTETCKLVENIISAMKHASDREKFTDHVIIIITDDDPSLWDSPVPFSGAPGQRNGGALTYTLLNEVLVCNHACDTIGGSCGAGQYRQWNVPVHEFNHSVELKLGKQAESDALYKPQQNDREYFAWSAQDWFASASDLSMNRDKMPGWEYDYMATIYDPDDPWLPNCP